MKDYRSIGWRDCPRCGQRGFAYWRRGHYEVKHHPQFQEAQQLTFIDTGLQLQKKKQKTCYISKKSGHHFVIVTSNDKRLKQNRIPTPKKNRGVCKMTDDIVINKLVDRIARAADLHPETVWLHVKALQKLLEATP